ncbi:hypothetical protein B0T10DRAFT_491743 [Thelonectria olida]|uniref:Secreted protein n=1 Tax=Thelonectria olida TaxID=1576542 RepID=A0A9P8W089_9HYPO|nr:hypothetical protein B0T10DRAFT_491743 [Thelonectria olida]
MTALLAVLSRFSCQGACLVDTNKHAALRVLFEWVSFVHSLLVHQTSCKNGPAWTNYERLTTDNRDTVINVPLRILYHDG